MNSLLSMQFPFLVDQFDAKCKFFTVLNLCCCCMFVRHAAYVIICVEARQILSNIILGT